MKLCIPQVGTELTLKKPWAFTVHYDHRNGSILRALGVPPEPRSHPGNYSVFDNAYKKDPYSSRAMRGWTRDVKSWAGSLPAKTVLRIDRIYLRKPASNYDSVTFVVVSCPDKPCEKARFWVKLTDANSMEISGMDQKSQAC